MEDGVRIGVIEFDCDHVTRQQGAVTGAEGLQRVRRANDKPVAGITLVQSQTVDLDDLSRLDTRQLGSEVDIRVVAGGADTLNKLEVVRRVRRVAGQQVDTAAAIDIVVALATGDEVDTAATFDMIVTGTAKEPVVTVAAEDFEVAERGTLLDIARINAVLAVQVRELVLRIGVDDIVTALGVDLKSFNLVDLEEEIGLQENTLLVGSALSVFRTE